MIGPWAKPSNVNYILGLVVVGDKQEHCFVN